MIKLKLVAEFNGEVIWAVHCFVTPTELQNFVDDMEVSQNVWKA